jgi:hypothetical protein
MKRALGTGIITLIFFATILLFAMPSEAALMFPTSIPDGIVPCATQANPLPCTLCDLIVGFYRIFQYGLFMVITLAFVAVTIAGIMYIVSTGNEGLMKAAKSFLQAALIGFTFVVAAWLLVNIVLWLITAKADLGIQRQSWWQIDCAISGAL